MTSHAIEPTSAISAHGYARLSAASLFFIAGLSAVCWARSPEDRTAASAATALHLWFENQHSVAGKWCCDVADGYLLDTENWRSSGSAYEVRIFKRWFLVPAAALRDTEGGPNLTGKAIVWYVVSEAGLQIECFAPGTEY